LQAGLSRPTPCGGGGEGDSTHALMRVTCALKPVAKTAYVKRQAVIKRDASLSEVYRACGAELASVEGDFQVPRFVCLAGEAPTYHIARALQEAGGVVRWREQKLEFLDNAALFEQDEVENVWSTAAEDVAADLQERHDIPTFYSVDDDGEYVRGDDAKERTQRFQPHANATALRHMTGVLVLRKVARLKYTRAVVAGDLLAIDDGDQEPLVALTVASLFATGTDGAAPTQYTRIWLGGLVT
jgi:hypothetical protein